MITEMNRPSIKPRFSIGQLARRFKGDKTGVVAIEFAMIVPVMALLFFGSVELSQAISADRRVTQVASATADLIARTKTTSASDIQAVLDIASFLMPAPTYDTSKLKITVVSVVADINNAAITKVAWSCKYHGGVGNYAVGATYALPAGVVDKGDSVIVSEVEYLYAPILTKQVVKTSVTMGEKFYLKPRLSSAVSFTGAACS